MEPLVAQIWMLLHDDGEREDLELHELQPMLLPVATIQWPNKDSGPVQAQAAEAPMVDITMNFLRSPLFSLFVVSVIWARKSKALPL